MVRPVNLVASAIMALGRAVLGELAVVKIPGTDGCHSIEASAARRAFPRGTEAGLRLKAPKTKRGRRNIALPQEAIAMLRGHKIRQMEIRLALGQGGAPSIVFSDIEGKHLKPNGISQLAETCKARGLPRVSFHALRHTHASTLIRAGVDILTISRRLGIAERR